MTDEGLEMKGDVWEVRGEGGGVGCGCSRICVPSRTCLPS